MEQNRDKIRKLGSGQKTLFLVGNVVSGPKTLHGVRKLCLGTRNKVLASENFVPENLPIWLKIDIIQYEVPPI